jgi:hypothetical protein
MIAEKGDLLKSEDVIRLISYLQRYQTQRGPTTKDVVFEDGVFDGSRKRKVSHTGTETGKRKRNGIVQVLRALVEDRKGNATALAYILKERIGWSGGDVGFVEACDALFSYTIVWLVS